MLHAEQIADLVSDESLPSLDKLLLCLAVNDANPKTVKEITAIGFDGGFRKIKKMNVSDSLSKSKGLAVRVSKGWKLSKLGMERVQQVAGPLLDSPAMKIASSLRTHLPNLTAKETAAFVEEAIICFEVRQHRAAVVLSWVGAVAVLYDFIMTSKLSDFNAAASKHFSNPRSPWIPAKTADELARMKENDFLLILEKISVIGKNVRQQLEACLKLRNACGHPNSYRLGEHKVSAHIEDLILNVFAKF